MNILIIDDTDADHDIIVGYLQEMDATYRFYHAYNADEGLSMYQSLPIDCVLLDYHMPGKDGLELLKQMTSDDKIVPIIMMTGDGNEFVAVTAMKLGSQDYIPKMILTPSALKRAVERAVERTEIIRRMERYRMELERSNHDLEQFANIVAHDLKAPLRAVTQHLSLIRNKVEQTLDEKSLRSLEFAVEGASRMRALIDALFEYAHIGFTEPHFNNVNLDTLLEQTMRDLSMVIEEREAIITHDALPEVWGDSILLSQLLQNLIANAIKYCKEKPRIHISATCDNQHWRIGVKDNGIGIHSAQHKQVFGIFRRLHQPDEYPGIGLGLAICERIVKQHGGAMGLESEPGKGSLFYFTLPVPQSQPVQEKKVAYG